MPDTSMTGTCMMREMIAVIDTETTFFDDVMSIGVVIADRETLCRQKSLYYVFPEQCGKPAMFGSALFMEGQDTIRKCRTDALAEIEYTFREWNVTMIFAYNALFDRSHLPELSGFVWKDIMKLAAYRQYNTFIPEDAPCCRTGRLRSGYGVENILRMISQDWCYAEVHNALCDAEDELRIMQLLGHDAGLYPEI